MTPKEIQALITATTRARKNLIAEVQHVVPATRDKPRAAMNRVEGLYAAFLEQQRTTGAVLFWAFEPMKIVLAPKTTYTPDFLVVRPQLPMRFVDIKGTKKELPWIEPDAALKIKLAAVLYWPFEFLVSWHVRGRWLERIYPPTTEDV